MISIKYGSKRVFVISVKGNKIVYFDFEKANSKMYKDLSVVFE